VPELILDTIAILDGILRYFDLDLDTDGLESVYFTDVDLFRHLQLILTTRENEVGVVGPLTVTIVDKDVFLLNLLTRRNSVVVLVLEPLDTEAEHLSHLVGRVV